MFCHECGESLLEGASFCNSCGANVSHQQTPLSATENQPTNHKKQPQQTTTSPSNPVTYQTNHPKSKPPTSNSKLPFLLPIISLLIVSVVLVLTFTSEQKKNETVLDLQTNAETSALEGDYDTAIDSLNEAIDIRPDYEVLQANLEEINRAKEFSNKLEIVGQTIASQNYVKAEQELLPLKEQVDTVESPLFTSFHESITSKEEQIAIGKLQQEIAELTTVDDLASKLSSLDTFSSSETETIRESILEKIVDITDKEATDFLANGQFAEALNAVNKGLSFNENNDQLLSLKDQIETEKLAFEELLAEEDLHNRTAAVEITSFTALLEENGDIYIEGTIRSTATVPIYTIIVFYAVYDLNGQYLQEGYVYVEPDLLNPGDYGYFAGYIPGIYQEATVEIFNITWYFDQ